MQITGHLKTFFSIGIIILLPLHLLCQQGFMADSQKLETYLHVIRSNKGFSGEVLVADSGSILFRKAVGFSTVENNTPLEPGAIYRVASISKTFTATLIAAAQAEHKLDLRDKAIKYIPALSPKFKDITIEQLLTHHSGLPHNEGIKDYWKIKSKQDMTTGQVIREINQLELLFEPGSGEHYSSPGYYLLATILESIYKKDFGTILQDKILAPLQLRETGIANGPGMTAQIVPGYHLVKEDSLVVAPYRNYSMLKGAGDMYSTTGDLWKWNNSFLPDGGYRYGWKSSAGENVKYYHGGGTWGYSGYTAFYPAEKISIILLCNVSTMPVSEIASDVEKIVFGRPFGMPLVRPETIQQNIDLQRYCGTYRSTSSPASLTIFTSGTGLYAQLAGKPAFELFSKAEYIFFGKKIDIEISFEQEDGAITGLKAVTRAGSFHFKKEYR